MPRIRSLKPEFWGHPKTARVSRDARLLFLGLLTESDDEGRQLGSAKRIAGAVFPNDDDVAAKNVTVWLDELERARMVTRYSVDDVAYLLIDGFTEHQKVAHATPSRLPPPGDIPLSESPPEILANNSGGTPESFSPDLGSRIVGSRKCTASAARAEFDSWWSLYPRKVDKAKACDLFVKRREEGVALETLTRARDAYALTVNGMEQRFVLLPSTFLGKKGRWADPWVQPTPDPIDAWNNR